MDNENRTLDDVKFRELLQKNVTHRVSSVGKDLIEFRASFQQSAQVIIDNVSQLLNSVEDEFLQDLRQEVSLMESGLRSRLEPELRNQMEPEVRQKVEAEFEERLNAAKQSGNDAALRKLDDKLGTLDTALREISLQSNQVDILTCYLDKAALFAPRVALFVIKSGNLVGWQARGFEGEFSNTSVKTLMFPADQDNFLRKVAETRSTYGTVTAGYPEVIEMASKFGPVAPDRVCAIPLVVRDKTVAVLYADSGLVPNVPLDTNSLEIITTVVSLTVELSSARAKLGVKPVEAVGTSHIEPARETSPAPSPTPPFVTQQAAPASDIRVDEGARVGSQAESPARPAPSAEPAQPFFVPPPAAEASPVVESPSAPTSVSYTPPSTGDLDETEQKLHNDARRFARLLVSEIKLYNEQKVQAGRRDKNLYSLLHDDIDKSREMYGKRVSPSVAANVDYFYDELVRILADNQVGALGADCPGPVVPSS